MTVTETPPAVTLDRLYAPFADRADYPDAEEVAAADLPGVYRELLDHPHHMTVTVERHYGDAVDVVVLDRVERGDHYARKIVLRRHTTGQPVQFGLVHVDLAALAPEVRAEILAGGTPLGRVLIRHDVMREVRPEAFLRVTLAEPMAGWLGAAAGAVTYGRLGVITAAGRPAVWVLEVLAPVAG